MIGPFDTVTRALETLDAVTIDAAIIDANLLDGIGTPLAQRLVQTGVPFLIYSRTGVPDDLQASPSPLPFEMKPGTGRAALRGHAPAPAPPARLTGWRVRIGPEDAMESRCHRRARPPRR
ncbi:response regulator [Sphingobium yanoikuyae]|uniref:hypothetical protein n=1 Tax=Sphingobium yanoikuyae TaxID=13690 RepID=UPI001C0EF272|nr:hypothetical protein [Sphingobium yanoikuyae]